MGLKYLNALDEETLDVEQKDWRGGADEFSTPTNLPDIVGGRLVNCIVEDNGRPRTRPGADALGGASLDAAQRIETLSYFDTPLLEYVFASINATFRRWNGAVWDTPAGYPFAARSIVEIAQGADTLYASDGVGQWFSFDGAAWSAGLGVDNTTAAGDPPVGATIMAWHTNRMFSTGIVGGVSDAVAASFIGGAGANQWDWVNFSFRVGRGEGEAIKALCAAQGQWLAIGKEGSIYFALTNPTAASAAAWPIDRLADSVGVLNKRTMRSAGGSLWCVGPDLALREIIHSGARVEGIPFELGPVASEAAKPYMDRINQGALSKVALAGYGRYLMLAVPLDNATEASHVLVWNMRIRLPSISGPGTVPAFIGVWTGWTPTCFAVSRFNGAERLLIGDTTGRVNMFKDRSDQTDEDTFVDNGTNVLAVQRTKSWDFGGRRNWKDAQSAELQFENSTPTVDVVLVLDGQEQQRSSKTLETVQNQLPLTLPFDLAVLGPVTATKAMDELPEFKEAYIEVQQLTRGRVELKSVAMSAFLNTTSEE